MATRRIPVCAGYLVRNAAPHIAGAIEHIRNQPCGELKRIIEDAIDASRSTLSLACVQHIMGSPLDPMAFESLAAAGRLCNEAIEAALKRPGIWDRRRSTRTRSELIVKYTNGHICSWMRDRGINPAEKGGDL
jgi:hypothetical protein